MIAKRPFVFIKSWVFLCVFSAHPMNLPIFWGKNVRTVSANRLQVRFAQRHRSFEITGEDVEKIVCITDPYFSHVPGYPSLKNQLDKSLHNPHRHTAKGYVYELEVALYFVKKEKQVI